MSRLSKTFLSSALFILACTLSGAQTGVRTLEDFPYVLIYTEGTDYTPVFDDEWYNANARGVTFPVSKTYLASDDPFLETLRNELLPKLKGENLTVRLVSVRGGASPEGKESFNKTLAEGRAKSLADAIGTIVGHEVPIETTAVTEDYSYLVWLMKIAEDQDYETIKALYDQYSDTPAVLKSKMRAVKGGLTWNRILQKYYPAVRASRIIIVTSEPKPEPKVEEVPAEPVVEPEPVPEVEPEEESEAAVIPAQAEEPAARRHLLALRTNLLYDLFYMPNYGFAPMWDIQAEYYPLHGHWTANAQFTSPYWHKWDQHKFFQIRNYHLEARRYFRGDGDFTGIYAGAYGEVSKYGIGLSDEKGWQGEGAGAGLSVGYVMPINRKGDLRLEFSAHPQSSGYDYPKI